MQARDKKSASSKSTLPKRKNRAIPLGEGLGSVLDPVLRKRGFASRDLVAHWPSIAPPPYDRLTLPDRLAWPRKDSPGQGATLYLRCREGHAMAVEHEGGAIAAAINRYYGYYLVAAVRPAAMPFEDNSPAPSQPPAPLPGAKREKLAATLSPVEDDGLREALERLGEALMRKSAGKPGPLTGS